VEGTVAITDYGWYEFLLQQRGLDEVNFWTPSASHGFNGPPMSPFFFKLKAKYHHAICGSGTSSSSSACPIRWRGSGLARETAARPSR